MCMAVIVTFRVQLTVKTTLVIYRMERALVVIQDGLDCLVIQNVMKDGTVLNVANNA